MTTTTEEALAREDGNAWVKSQILCLPYASSSHWTDDHTNIVNSFFADILQRRLVAYVSTAQEGGALVLSSNLPSPVVLNQLDKVAFVLKSPDARDPASFKTEADVRHNTQVGIVRSGNAAETLLKLMSAVYIPLLSADRNWPETVKKEFSSQLHRFMASLTEHFYQQKGSTVLYVPIEDLIPEKAAKDKDVMQLLESTLIHWTRQVKEVLNRQETSENLEDKGPLEEIAFWRSRTIDLSGIQQQLQREGVRQIVEALEIAKSGYLQPFLNLSNNIEEGLAEAQDNLKFLSTMQDSSEKMAEAPLKDIPPLLPRLLTCVRMIWGISRFYHTTDRLTGLLRKISNEIIRRCCEQLSLEAIFGENVEWSMVSLQECISCGEAWRQIYRQVISKGVKKQGGRVWTVDESSVFAQMDAFVQRCRDLLEVCEAQLQFSFKTRASKGDMPFFGGSRAAEIRKNLGEIELSFERMMTDLRNLDYNILDVKATRWHDDYTLFKTGVKDLEIMMQSVITSAFDCVSNAFGASDLTESCMHLAKREAIQRHVDKKAMKIITLFMQDMSSIKKEFEQRKKSPPLHPTFARISGGALWAKGFALRAERQFQVLSSADYYTTIPEFEDARTVYEALMSSLSEFIERSYSEWTHSIDGSLSKHLENSLLVRSTDDRTLIEHNFDKGLLKLFNEARCWQKLGYAAPYYATEILAQEERLRLLRDHVQLLVCDYNAVISSIPTGEKELFREKVRSLDRKIAPGLTRLNWLSKGIVDYFVKDTRQNCDDMRKLIDEFKATKMQIRRLCHQISTTSLVKIDRKTIYEQAEFEDVQAKHREHVKNMFIASHEKMKDVLDTAYTFFKSDSSDIQAEWIQFVEGLDRLVEKSLHQTVHVSLQHLSREVNGDARHDVRQFFKVNVCLEGNKVEFRPTMKDLTGMIEMVSQELIRTVAAVPHLAHTVASAKDEGDGDSEGDENGKTPPPPSIQEAPPPREKLTPRIPTLNVPQITSSRRASLSPRTGRPSIDMGNLTARKTREMATTARRKSICTEHASRRKSLVRPTETGTTSETPSESRAKQREEEKEAKIREKSFWGVISAQEDVLKIVISIINGMHTNNDNLQMYLSYWDKYKNIWELDKDAFIRRYAKANRTLASFDTDISRYKELQISVQNEETIKNVAFVRLDTSPLKNSLVAHCISWQQKLLTLLNSIASKELTALHSNFEENITRLRQHPTDLAMLADSLNRYKELQSELPSLEARLAPLHVQYDTLEKFEYASPDEELELLDELDAEWASFRQALMDADVMLANSKEAFRAQVISSIEEQDKYIVNLREEITHRGPYSDKLTVLEARRIIEEFRAMIRVFYERDEALLDGMEIFNIPRNKYPDVTAASKDLGVMESMWTIVEEWDTLWTTWKAQPFRTIDVKDMEEQGMQFQRRIVKLGKDAKHWRVWEVTKEHIDAFKRMTPLIMDLRSPALRPRHWNQLMEELGRTFDPDDDAFVLDKVFALGLDQYSEVISALASSASKELAIDEALVGIEAVWKKLKLDIVPYKELGHFKLRSTDDIFTALEDHQASLSTMKASRFSLPFERQVTYWENTLSHISEVVENVLAVQRQWMYLENIFIGSEDIRRQLPGESAIFDKLNANWRVTMQKLCEAENVLKGAEISGILPSLQSMITILDRIQKSLDQYLETKRSAFPRFYFLSNDDLLEILGQSKDPLAVQPHLKKCFEALHKLSFLKPGQDGRQSFEATGMYSPDGEFVHFQSSAVTIEGPVEAWLAEVEGAMKATMKRRLTAALMDLLAKKREKWVREWKWEGQMMITSSQVLWTQEVTKALQETSSGNRTALKNLKKKQVAFLGKLTELVGGELTKLQRKKLVALITIEVHMRDVIEALAKAGCSSVGDFDWQSQLRFYWEKDSEECIVRQNMFGFPYGYEYLGNSGRLVITPLTDRCYMTLTTALHLKRGGNPLGPAGTGKTETVKDLGKAFAKYVLVFNCSESLDYKSLGRMFKGLAQTGSWSCLDEFNRIDVEVLSVVAQQIQCIQMAIAREAETFVFECEEIPLNRTCGVFVTMNPGYAGRSELPDNLKALLRPVSMMVPDAALICEIMLFSEGFIGAKALAHKISTLYQLAIQQLSKQDHYDFGLRAIKSVLVTAGALKRNDPTQNEDVILLRAVKDMNLPKLVSDDSKLFLSLLLDLFPGVESPVPNYGALEKAIVDELQAQGLQNHPYMVSKVIQLYDTKLTRHGNMLVGKSGSGKTTCWTTLQRALTHLRKEGATDFHVVKTFVINPKALTLNELYGAYDEATHEWTDGVLSNLMRTACSDERPDEKWIVFDGPVDTLWIESMNTVLDDNKLLTLTSGERIAMPPQVSLLFEVADLAVASPATVSRAGMVYLDVECLGWQPYLESWLQRKEDKEARAHLRSLFDRYLAKLLEFKRSECHEIVPISDLNAVQSLCCLYDAVGTVENGCDPKDVDFYTRMIELWFLFSVIWSVGGSLNEASRGKFDMFLREIDEQFPSKDTVFEYFVDPAKKSWASWEEKIPPAWRPLPDTPFYKILVPTVDSVRNSFLVNALVKGKRNVLLVGNTGTGKTSVVQNVLAHLDETMTALTINASSQTDSVKVQEIIDARLEKRTKDVYAPPSGKQLLVFIDDFNMPQKDAFGSQPPLELMRQWIDHGFFYDRSKMVIRYVRDMQLVCAMGPPGGGRSEISSRLLGRFHVINITFPSEPQVKRIYGTLINHMLTLFDEELKPLGDIMTQATLEVYTTVCADMLPVPSKPHYLFNMRDLSKVFQGLLQADPNFYDTPESMIRLWVHECFRVFHDRLNDVPDREWFKKLISGKLTSLFATSWDELFKNSRVPVFVDFMREGTDIQPYEEISDDAQLKSFVEAKLEEYNVSGFVPMNLVLFNDAVHHVCRINRVIKQPRGHVLLVGVGGSGRQSLARLATFVAGYQLFQIEVGKSYRLAELREDLKKLYTKCGADMKPTVFLVSDSQLRCDGFWEDINNMLSSGEVPNLFSADDLGAIRDAVRPEAKKLGRSETNDALFDFFMERVAANLHIVLCTSPVGEAFRNRIRKFPALSSCTTIDWFSEWPLDALKEVATAMLSPVDLPDKMKASAAEVLVTLQKSVEEMSHKMILEVKRYNYVTPRNFLELVEGYRRLLEEKRKAIGDAANKLLGGLKKLDDTCTQVKDMSQELEKNKERVAKAQRDAEELLMEIVQERRQADEQRKQIAADKTRLAKEEEDLSVDAEEAQKDLNEALPALEEAQKALDSLNKKDLSEVKAYSKPPPVVELVLSAVMVFLKSEPTWSEAKRRLGDPQFLHKLMTYDRTNISDALLAKISKYTQQSAFMPEEVGKVSTACKSLCMWVRAMEEFGRIFKIVAPKKARVSAAQESLVAKQAAVNKAEIHLEEITEKVDALKQKYEQSVVENERLKKESEELELKLIRAEQLVGGLSSERARWEVSVGHYEEALENLPGDCLIAAAFLSYAGPFASEYRERLLSKAWCPEVDRLQIPRTTPFVVSSFLSNPVDVRDWNLKGLPHDSFSTENGVLVTRKGRYPLMIDPQGQANQWIKNMETGNGLKVVNPKMHDLLRTLENSIQFGTPVLLEDVTEELDSSLDRILDKAYVKIGGRYILRLGDKEIEWNPDFRLYMTTKLHNPHFPPEVSARTTIVNFALSHTGLEQQLLGIVVCKERPELEEQKNELVIEVAEGKRKLEELEDNILQLLSTASGSLLDDEQLIHALQSSKTTADDVKTKLQVSEETEEQIDRARGAYQPSSERAATLYFVLRDLALVDPMYQFALDAYIALFNLSIDRCPKEDEVEDRIRTLNEYHTYAVYRNTCRALFEKHKTLFAFQLCIKILQSAGKINSEEYMFFLRGGQVLDRATQQRNPAPEWISASAWDNLTELNKIDSFTGITMSIVQNLGEWKDWYTSAEPETAALPGEWRNKCNDLQRLMFLRSLRTDRLIPAVTSFIITALGQKYVEPPVLDLGEVLGESTPASPLLFVLSQGVDPSEALAQIATSRGMLDNLKSIALGQGQAPAAEKLIAEGIIEGHWVFLANCHLSISWLPRLERIIANIEQASNVHKNFRLWLSSAPHPAFPISILQCSLKMTTEPPKGLRANLLRLYNGITEQAFMRCQHGSKYRMLLFALSFFHAVLLERKKFLELGWTIPYDFSDADFKVAEDVLAIYLDEYDETPWMALKFLIADTIYGGRVTDDWDRRLVSVYIDQYFCEETLATTNFRLSSLPTYCIPSDGTLQSFRDYIQGLPTVDKPEAFGQHPNADIASQIEAANTLLDTVLSMQPRVVPLGGESRDDRVLKVASGILDRIPNKMDIQATRVKVEETNPLSVVLLQEMARYNALLQTVQRSLIDLQMGIRGEVVMSTELDELFESLCDGKVPTLWQKAYPSQKPLAAWTRELNLRIEQLRNWAENGTPKVFWLGGLTFPTGFLTALLQAAARRNNVVIDSLGWEFVVLNQSEADIAHPPKEGVYIKDLFIEGARWDKERGCLAEPRLMELVSPMPIVHFKPIESRRKAPKGMYACPCYMYPVRTGTRERPSFVISIELKSGSVDPEHWIKRGTALLLTLAG